MGNVSEGGLIRGLVEHVDLLKYTLRAASLVAVLQELLLLSFLLLTQLQRRCQDHIVLLRRIQILRV